jgi:hypothetical protein
MLWSAGGRRAVYKHRRPVRSLGITCDQTWAEDNETHHAASMASHSVTLQRQAGAGLDEVRRLLSHESLNTTLRYSLLVGAEL